MAQNNMGAATQFPMLASGLTNTMPSQPDEQQQVMQMFQMLQSQLQGQQAPQMEPVPQSPTNIQAFLSQLLGNVGSAIAQNPQYSAQAERGIYGSREAHGDAEQRNLQRTNTFDLQKQSAMLDLAMKRLDVGIGMAKQAKDADTEQKLIKMKGEIQGHQQQVDFEHDLAKIDEAQKLQTEREQMKQGQQNVRSAQREASLNQRAAARAPAAKAAGAKGAGKTPQANWPSQYMKSYSTDLTDAAKAVKDKLAGDDVKRHIGPMAIGGPDAKKVKAVRDQYEKYKKDLFEYYQGEVDKFVKGQGAAPTK